MSRHHRGGKYQLRKLQRSELDRRRKRKKIGNEKHVDFELKDSQHRPLLLLSAFKLILMEHSLYYP